VPLFETWGQVIQAVAAAIAFPTIIFQLWLLRRNLLAATQDRLYAHYTEVCKLFMQNPELRRFFYQFEAASAQTADGQTTPSSTATALPAVAQQTELAKAAFMCEAIFGLIEHAALQMHNVPKDAWTRCWRPYAVERVAQSDTLEKFFDPNAHWYTQTMRDVMKTIKQEALEARSKKVLAWLHEHRKRHSEPWAPF
jgi:hypothetical protein